MFRIGSATAFAFAVVVSISTMHAFPGGRSNREACTAGQAITMFEALLVPTQIMRPRGIESPLMLDSLNKCQFRLFLNGQTFVFSEQDIFAGGVAYLYDYAQAGVAREAAIEELERSVDRVWLASVLPGGIVGPFVEQPLLETAYKNISSPVFGLIVYQQRGFITQLAPGEYRSYWESRYLGALEASATVTLIITPGS